MEQLWLLSVKLSKSKTDPSKPARAIAIYDSIRQVLFRDWDPVGVHSSDRCGDEYDSYIPKVYRILVGSRSEDELIDCLTRIERDGLGVEPASPDKFRPIARKLLSLKVTLD